MSLTVKQLIVLLDGQERNTVIWDGFRCKDRITSIIIVYVQHFSLRKKVTLLI